MTKWTRGAPSIFKIYPEDASSVLKKDLFKKKFYLQLYCQADDGWHEVDESGIYELEEPRKWFAVLRPILQRTLPYLRFAIPVVAASVRLDPDLLEERRKLLSTQLELMKHVVNSIPTELPRDSGSGAKDHLTQIERMEGAALRQLYALLVQLDPDRVWGNLRPLTMESGEQLWLCPKHYEELRRQPVGYGGP